ncbi:G-protein-signaling modulator 1 [Solea solea]|uniref:G-protein-signaling modulator 1 n=1 Tax=Solea solea TaxID=90069 RepID=UPI00272A2A27|nr:G-protein-signaling modulator 1 [Solea solea]
MTEEGPLDVLVITEEGDAESGATGSLVVTTQSFTGESPQKEEEEKNEDLVSKICLNEQSTEKQHSDTERGQMGKLNENNDKPGGTENTDDGQNREGLTDEMRINEKSEEACDTNDEKVTQNDPQLDIKMLKISEPHEEDPKKTHRLTPDFPDALYELLCTLQEGRRLNDQRCSFRLESGVQRRRCHSEPNTNKPARRVIFSSLTSLQKEEFFELVATAQARRLDDQRALLERSPPPKPRFRSFRGSIKQLSLVRKPAPVPPVPKEDLYNMILTTQAQGRLEDQRSRAPGPMDDEDFFSLLLKVQGGRMEEQRTELPCMLQT